LGGRWYNRFSCSGEESVSVLELVAGKQVERADFSSPDNRSVRPPSLSEVGRSHRGNLRRLAFSGFHGLPPKISDGQEFRSEAERRYFDTLTFAPNEIKGDEGGAFFVSAFHVLQAGKQLLESMKRIPQCEIHATAEGGLPVY